jgi:hypothetical protein
MSCQPGAVSTALSIPSMTRPGSSQSWRSRTVAMPTGRDGLARAADILEHASLHPPSNTFRARALSAWPPTRWSGAGPVGEGSAGLQRIQERVPAGGGYLWVP